MRALVVLHDPGSIPSLVGDRLEHHGYALEYLTIAPSIHDADVTVTFPDPTDYDLILPMGAVWSLYDHDTIGNWIDDELAFLRAADAASVPVLGVCFGGQALAAAHGGEVVRSDTPQIGWYQVDSSIPESLAAGPWMQWHYDRFEAPVGSTVLAHDDVGVQAFRLRRNLGLQFHPEVTPEHVTMWLDMGGEDEEKALVALGSSRAGLIEDCERNVLASTPNANRLVDWFLAEVAPTPVG